MDCCTNERSRFIPNLDLIQMERMKGKVHLSESTIHKWTNVFPSSSHKFPIYRKHFEFKKIQVSLNANKNANHSKVLFNLGYFPRFRNRDVSLVKGEGCSCHWLVVDLDASDVFASLKRIFSVSKVFSCRRIASRLCVCNGNHIKRWDRTAKLPATQDRYKFSDHPELIRSASRGKYEEMSKISNLRLTRWYPVNLNKKVGLYIFRGKYSLNIYIYI